MLEEVHDYLKDYGFTEKEICMIENKNDNIFFITLEEIMDRMMYFDSKEIEKNIIIGMINDNPDILNITSSEISKIDDLFIDELNFDLSELSQLILKKPTLYNVGSEKIRKVINYLYSKGIDENDVKIVLLNNIDIII